MIINIYLRFALMALFLGGGIILAFWQGFLYALPFLLVGIALLVGYLLLGTIQSASQMVQDENFAEAKKRLGLTLKPNWLYKDFRPVYHMLQGTIAAQQGDESAAESWFREAEGSDLGGDNEKAMVQMQLANIDAKKGKWQAAEQRLKKIKKLKVTQPELKEQIKMFDKAMSRSNLGQMKHMRQGGKGGAMTGRSGKRRRPKMR